MKSKKILVRIVGLFTLFTLGIGVVIFNHSNTIKAEADQYIGDYDPYTYTGTYYSSIDFSSSQGMNGSLRESITNLIIPKGFYTYSGSGETHLSTQLQYADEDPTNSNNMVLLYTRNSIPKTAATVNSEVIWNREHVWCQSLSNGNWGEKQGGTDILHLRPVYPSTNSSRNNKPYADLNKQGAKYYNSMLYGYSTNTYFEPIDQVKGDVARIVMYLWTCYKDYPNYNDLDILNVFKDYDTLIKWHTLDKPDVLEGNRNDYCESSKQGNRNPFVDHPELAWKIFGDAPNLSTDIKNDCITAYPADGGELINNDTTRVNFGFADYASAHSISSGTKVSSISLDPVVTATATGTDGNTGKIYIQKDTNVTEWRFYSSGSGTVRISVADGYELISAKGQIATTGYGNTNQVVFNISNNVAEYTSDANFNIQSLNILYRTALSSKDLIERTNTITSLSYNYTKEGNGAIDVLNRAFTGMSGTNYTDWDSKDGVSGVVYAGQSAGGNDSIQLRSNNSNSGIITTANAYNLVPKKITIKWNTNTVIDRQITVYGKDSPYASPTELYANGTRGTLLATLTKNENNDDSISVIDTTFKYIGIRSKENASYISSIEIQWGDLPTYTFDYVGIRFGGFISKTLWDGLDADSTIVGYGVMLSKNGTAIKNSYLSNKTNENTIDEAIALTCDGTNNKNFYTELTNVKTHPSEANAAQKGNLQGVYYIWNLYEDIKVAEHYLREYKAVAYIRTNTEIVFLNQVAASVSSLAQDLIDDNSNVYGIYSFEGSLNYLASLEQGGNE